MKFKSIDFSYPTSPNAERFGFEDGCWTVSLKEPGGLPKADAGFATKAEAIEHAQSLPYDWASFLGRTLKPLEAA